MQMLPKEQAGAPFAFGSRHFLADPLHGYPGSVGGRNPSGSGEAAAIVAAAECLARWAPGHSAPTLMVGASESNRGVAKIQAGERNRTSNPRFTKALLYH